VLLGDQTLKIKYTINQVFFTQYYVLFYVCTGININLHESWGSDRTNLISIHLPPQLKEKSITVMAGNEDKKTKQ